MKKFAVAAALLSAVVATPALAQNGEGDKAFAGVEIAGDKVLIDGAKVQFSSGARLGANLGTNGKLYATGGYTFGQIDDPYVGAGYQHKLTQNVYGKVEYRHQFINNFDDTDAFAVGVGFAF